MPTAADYLAAARRYLGVPYLFGGVSAAGLDCSGLTMLAARDIGISIPRTSEAQWATLSAILKPEPACLVFFDVPSDTQAQPAHVGIVTQAPGQMLNAPYTGTVVRYDPIEGPGRTVMGYGLIPGLSAPPAPPHEELPVPILVEFSGSFWVVSADLTTRVKVATTADGSAIDALGYKVVTLSAAQMAAIPVVG